MMEKRVKSIINTYPLLSIFKNPLFLSCKDSHLVYDLIHFPGVLGFRFGIEILWTYIVPKSLLWYHENTKMKIKLLEVAVLGLMLKN